jgi:hypothetical protein
MGKTCVECGEHAGFHWVFASTGKEVFLCRKHYEAMELEMHRDEKAKRLVATTFSVVSGKQPEFTDCPIGEHCKWCIEVGLRPPLKLKQEQL